MLILLTNSGYSQVKLWGITTLGGKSGNGTIFSFSDNALTSHHSFGALQTGEFPGNEKLVQASNGKLYGMTTYGGTYNGGIIYEFDLKTNSYSVLHTFDRPLSGDGSNPMGGLIQASNGKLYGTANGGSKGGGVLFEMDIDSKKYLKLHDFETQTGKGPANYLIEAGNKKLIGVASDGGSNDNGVIFEFDIVTNQYSRKFDFRVEHGMYNRSGLMKASNGKYYGMMERGGRNDRGTIYEYDPISNEVVVKRSFGENSDGTYVAGENPYSLLVEHPNGKFYAVTTRGGYSRAGNLIEYDLASNTVKEKMDVGSLFRGSPVGGIVLASSGKLYGMTKSFFIFTTPESTFYEFDVATDKFKLGIISTPSAKCTLLQASDGLLYGVSELGGYNSRGELFGIDPKSNILNTIFSFDQSPDGANPCGHLEQAYNGKFYGMTKVGGNDKNSGVIFEFDPALKSYSKKVDFKLKEQSTPNGGFILHPNGKLYAIISNGGKKVSLGSIIEFDPEKGVISHNLPFDEMGEKVFSETYGENPLGDMLLAPNGQMYALVSEGGLYNMGTLIEYNPIEHSIKKKIDFSESIGRTPKGSLILGANGKLYGVTSLGGISNCGTLFEYDYIENEITKKIDFSLNTGCNFEGTMTLAGDKKIYGLTRTGFIFRFDPENGTLVTTYDLSMASPTSNFFGNLIALSNGKLYGTTLYSGDNKMGSIIAYDPKANTVNFIHSFNGLDGANPENCSLSTFKDEQFLFILKEVVNVKFGDAPFELSNVVNSTSGLPIQALIEDPSIATISNGMIIIKKPGITNIILNQLGDSEHLPAKSLIVKFVVDKAVLQVTAPQLSKIYGEDMPEIVLSYDGFKGTDDIKVIDVLPTISYTATKTSNVGTYPITIITGNDENYSFSLKDGYIEIKQSKQVITFPTVGKITGDAPFDLNATSSSGLEVFFKSDNTEILAVQGKTATILGFGIVQIVASQPGSLNFFAADDVVQSIEIKQVTVGTDNDVANKLVVYPIPATNRLFIEFDGEKRPELIQILDLIGQVVMEVKIIERDSIDISLLPPGLYFLRSEVANVRIQKL